jgi:hypothetical protein
MRLGEGLSLHLILILIASRVSKSAYVVDHANVSVAIGEGFQLRRGYFQSVRPGIRRMYINVSKRILSD